MVNQRVPDQSITDELVRLGNLPSFAFGMHSCSHKWKIVPQEKFLAKWQPALDAWARGGRVTRAIGLDNSGADQKRTFRTSKHDNDKFESWFPLQDFKIDRAECVRMIKAAGLPVPPKSSCFFCPAMKPWEIKELGETEPEKLELALQIEKTFLESGKAQTTKGLARSKSWAEILEKETICN
jgi:hypothetical protein